MRYLKTYELLNGGRIMKAALNDLKSMQHGWNELMQSIVNKEYKKFMKLIKNTDLEEVDNDGNTALLIASSDGKLTMVKELIKAGADITHKNKNGEDFYDLAVNRYKFINGVKDWIEKTYPEFVMAKKYNL